MHTSEVLSQVAGEPDMAKYRVTLTPEERFDLQKMVSTGKAAARKLTHARILLLGDQGSEGPGKTNQQIVQALGVSERTIERVRKRFVLESLSQAIHPRPQPPRPQKVLLQASEEAQLIELACSEPPSGQAHWTLQLLAEQLVLLQVLEHLSKETVRKVLKKTTLI
jgi:transposase